MMPLKHIRKKEQYTTTLTSIQSQQTAKMQTPNLIKYRPGCFLNLQVVRVSLGVTPSLADTLTKSTLSSP